MQIDGQLLLELKTNPMLGFLLTAPVSEEQALRFFVPLSPSAAQSLALALLAMPGVGFDLRPDLAEAIDQEAAAMAHSDQAFLKAVGVADADA